MKLHPSLAFVAVAFALGAAFAQPAAPLAAAQSQSTPLERLEALEKRAAQVDALIASLKPAKPGTAAPELDATKLDQLSKQMESVLVYLAAQAESAKRLDAKLKVSEVQGFTWGINPESRETLLAGFADFTSTLTTDVPSAKPAPAGSTAARR